MKKKKPVKFKNKTKKTKTQSPPKQGPKGILPLADRVLVKPFTEEELKNKNNNSSYGIILPETVSKEKSAQGKVLAVGPGRLSDGKIVPVGVKPGDIVVFSKYGYDEVEYQGEEFYLLKEDNILAVIRQ